jgi:hypothetical protein
VRETSNRLISLLVAATVSATLTPSVRSETSVKSSTGSANYRDWQHFNPQKFTAPERLIPAASVAPQHSASYDKGVPAFPQDPTHANVIYGRGKDELPTAIYAKAFDVLQVGGKLFQAPAAGEVKHITVDGQGVAIYGTTVYTPLPNSAMVGNPVQVKPFDPSRIFYKDKDLWPAVIYAEPGKEITIANQKVVVPAAGQSVALIFDASGHLKQPAQQGNASSDSEKAAAEKTAAEKAAAEKAAAEKAAAEKAASEKAASEKAASEKAAAEKAAVEKAAAEKAAAEKAASEKAATEKAAAEKAATEKAAAEKTAAERAAAEKAAAEKAAAEKAAAEKAAAEKAASDKAATDKATTTAQQNAGGGGGGGTSKPEESDSNTGGLEGGEPDLAFNLIGENLGPPAQADSADAKTAPQKHNIQGEWETQNTTTTNTFRVRIDYAGLLITATIVNQGSGYIPVGQVRFKGNYTSNPFDVTVQRAYPGYTNPYWEPGVLTVTDANNIKIAARTGNLVLTRFIAPPPPPPPSPSPDPVASPEDQKKAKEEAARKEYSDELMAKYKEGPEVIEGRSNQAYKDRTDAIRSWAEDVYQISHDTHREYAAVLYQDKNGDWHYTPSLRGLPAESYPDQAAQRWVPKDSGVNINGPTDLNQGYAELHTHDGHETTGATDLEKKVQPEAFFDGLHFSNHDGDLSHAETTGRNSIMVDGLGKVHEYMPYNERTDKGSDYVDISIDVGTKK